jgi:hypothetical protein
MAGRGLRVLDGKKDCLLLDFVGRNGAHKLASAIDILGGKYDEMTVSKAKEIADREEGAMPAQEALELAAKEIAEAKQREAARRSRIKAKVAYRTEAVSPFDVLHMRPLVDDHSARFGMTATEKQIAYLQRKGIEPDEGMSRARASQLIGSLAKRQDLGLATYKQAAFLRRYGITDINISKDRASEMYEAIKQNGWRLPANLAKAPAREPGGGEDELY